MKKPHLNAIENYVPLILIVACIASFRYVEQEAIVLLIFFITLIIYVLRKYDSRILISFAIILLISTAAVLARGLESHAEQIAILAYYFLVVGVVAQFVEYLREGNEKHREDRKNY